MVFPTSVDKPLGVVRVGDALRKIVFNVILETLTISQPETEKETKTSQYVQHIGKE